VIRCVNFTLTVGKRENFCFVRVNFDVCAVGQSPLFLGFIGPVGICDADGAVGVVDFNGTVFEAMLDLTAINFKENLIFYRRFKTFNSLWILQDLKSIDVRCVPGVGFTVVILHCSLVDVRLLDVLVKVEHSDQHSIR
jgi:hypothetical protein